MFYYRINFDYNFTKNKKIEIQNILCLRITNKGFVGLFFKSELVPV